MKTSLAIKNLVEAIKVGKASELLFDELDEQKQQLEALDVTISRIQSEQSSRAVPVQEPTAAYREAIDRLHHGIAGRATKSAAMEILRSLIEAIVVGGDDDDPERVTLSGDAGFSD